MRGIASAAAGLAVVAGASFAALSAHLAPAAALLLGVGLGLALALVLLWARERRRRALRAQAREAERQRRREASWRVYWQAAADLAPDGWARRDLEALRLVARNLRPGEPLGDRMARRVREATSAVLARVLDRMTDLVVAGRRIGAPEDRLEAFRTAGELLAGELEEARAAEGEPPPFDPEAVVRVVDSTAALADELREAVRSEIVVDVVGLAERLVGEARRAFRRELRLHLAENARRIPVAVRGSDLEQAVDALLARLLASSHVVGPVELEIHHRGTDAHLRIGWRTDDRLRLDPERIVAPLRALAGYGATITVDEDLDAERVSVELRLPLAEVRVAT
ncbi:MAG: hypothetical protein D6738_12000 [Acidobacteria bacterium]|nr:MAG: hypothetical protein D6738_12000 [Acidobacteriota bacterium]